MPKVLIADELSPRAVEIFRERGVEADVAIGLQPDELRDSDRRAMTGWRCARRPR